MTTSNALHPIPKPPSKPLVGNATTVDPNQPLQSLMGLTRDLGPIFWLDMMGKPMVIASGAELVNELCDEKRFDKAVRGALRKVRAIGGDGLFTGDTHAPNWSKAHNILLPTFSQKAMVDYFPMMVDIASQLVMKWERMNADDEIDVVHDMTGLALDTIGVCGFDYRFNSFYRADFHPFIDALTRTLETCMVQRGLPFENVALRGRLEQLRKDTDYMNNLVDEIIRERRRGKSGEAANDLLNYMLAGVDKATGESLSDENIRYQINTFLIAGHETTSGLLSFTLYFLLNNPDALEKAYAEVDAVLGRDIATAPTYQQIAKLDYIRAILLESLRLWPTAPAFSVYPYEDEVIGGEYHLKKNTFVTVLTLMLHRDKSIWGDNPDVFNPENFSREAEAARPAYAYKPFGNGQRACIGRQFAMQEAILVIGMILQRFQLLDPNNYKLKVKETMSIKPDGFFMKVRMRPEVTRSTLAPVTANDDVAPHKEESRAPKHGTPLCVLYGSNLGATEGFAREIAHGGDVNGFATTLAPLDDFAGRLPTEGAVVIASASYNGAPPDNAAKFIDWLDGLSGKALEGVTYAVFGCGNRDWAATYQSIPRNIDEKMSALGAKRLKNRGEADAREDQDGQFQEWFDDLWPATGDALGLSIDFSEPQEVEPLYRIEIAESVTAHPVAMQTGAIPMRVVENRELQNHEGANPATRSTRHIEVELPDGVSYTPGDHLCVVPVNRPGVAERVIKRFGYSNDSYIKIHATGGRRSPFPNDSTFSVRRLADLYGEIQSTASRKDVGVLARHTRCPDTKAKLEALAAPASDKEDVYRKEVFLKHKSIFDLLEEYPACELPFESFLEMVPWLTPRYYSISSSPKADKGRCSITVGVVEGPARSGNGRYEGVCSNYLANARAGDIIHAVIKTPAGAFRMPEDTTKPIIMVGPGTGLAPFRGFIRERRVLKAGGADLGPAMLFFGCRNSNHDYIYADELQDADRDGLVDLYTAFSRADSERAYVQDIIRNERERVWSLLKQGAVVYVCGDGSAMEPDVKRTLMTIFMEENDADLAAAEAWIEDLTKEGRYNLDVWAGS